MNLDWVSLVKTLAPGIVAAAVPGVGPILAPLVAQAIISAEKMGGTGADKRQHALELVSVGAQVTNAVSKKDVLPTEVTVATAGMVIDTTVNVVNLVHRAKASGAPAS
jgi:hypothetical protein